MIGAEADVENTMRHFMAYAGGIGPLSTL